MRKNRQGAFFVFAICIFALTPIDTKPCMLNLYKFKVFSGERMDYLKRHASLKEWSQVFVHLTISVYRAHPIKPFSIAGKFGEQEIPFLGEKLRHD